MNTKQLIGADLNLVRYCVSREVERTQSDIVFANSMIKTLDSKENKDTQSIDGYRKHLKSRKEHLKDLEELAKMLESSSSIELKM